jgi:cell division transport system permease protein
MIGFLAASSLEKRLLPGGKLTGPTPWLIAIMLFVMTIVGAAGLALAQSGRTLERGVAHQATVEIAGGRGAGPAVAALKAAPGVTAAAQVAPEDVRKLADRWLGSSALDPQSGIPLPVLIDVDLTPGADLGPIRQRLAAAVPDARLVPHRQRVGPLIGLIAGLGWTALGLVLLIGLATAAAVVLATRASFNANRETIRILHGIGATDGQVTDLFQRRIAIDSLVGGACGTFAALLLLALLSAGGMGGLEELAGGALLSLADFASLLILPLLAAALATMVARRTLVGALREEL